LKFGKVAICISGLLRTGLKGHEAFKQFFNSLPNGYDVFYHTWDIKNDVIQQVNDLYNPVAYKVQPSLNKEKESSFGSMLYSIMMANELKKQHEIDNDFRYDLVIKTRFDLVFKEDARFPTTEIYPRTIYSTGGNSGINHTDFDHHGISDLIFWGDSQSMDLATDTYRYYKHVALVNDRYLRAGYKLDPSNYYFSPGTLIYDKTVKRNVAHIRYVTGVNEIPWREDVAHLDPIKDYNLIKRRYAQG
jgi:hypothetical protein